MSKITPEHLARQAVVYIRQSTPDQVVHNLESKRRQYNLPERARQLGWGDVAVIDDDLGRSGGGVARPGFEKLLAAICEVRVGVVVSIEASRLARNGRDWHTLLEFCGLVGTLIADEDGVYDPRQPNDRLLLGIGGDLERGLGAVQQDQAGDPRRIQGGRRAGARQSRTRMSAPLLRTNRAAASFSRKVKCLPQCPPRPARSRVCQRCCRQRKQ